jgi:propionate CoA-transferase
MNRFDITDAIKTIKDGSTIVVGGAGAGHAVPDLILKAIGEQFKATGKPSGLTIIHPCGVGDNHERGLNHIAYEGLIKRNIGGFWGNAPKLAKLALENKIEAYNLPQGVLAHLMRATAGGENGLLTKVGLNTFVDSDYEGGKINDITTENIVEKIIINGNEMLFYKCHPVDVAIIRGTYADEEGNISMEEEVGTFSMLSLAQAAKVNNGVVIVQVKKIKKGFHTPPERVKVPGVLVDYIIEDPNQSMTFITHYDEALINRTTPFDQDDMALEGIKRVICRRAALEIKRNGFINLGYGMPDGVPGVVNEEGLKEQVVFMIEQGQINGTLTTGLNFGAMYNPSAIIDDGYQFDFFHGGGLDVCFLGFAQIDSDGNLNSSRFGNTLTGCGGFIDISQNTSKVVFCGAFSTKSDIEVTENGLNIKNPGKHKKFVKKVQQVTFNGKYAAHLGKQVYYITERAVFKLTNDGIQLIEIAPGTDLENDILSMMEFRPIIKNIERMDISIFSEKGFNLNSKLK